MQGEVGCPSQLEYSHAIHSIEWTEYSQAKWNLRRTIGDAVRNIPSSVFTMIDLKYTFMLQSFGMLRSNLLKEVIYRRPSFYAMQHVFSYFDEDVHPVGIETKAVGGHTLEIARFERQSSDVLVLWFSEERPGDKLAYEPTTVEVKSAKITEPVWVDLLTGKIAKIPASSIAWKDGVLTLKDLPLWDSPIMIAPNAQVPRRTEWEKMKPSEIIDALYCPNRRFNCWVSPAPGQKPLPIKMDVSNEPWTKMEAKDFLPCFDKYGQFKHREWPGKTHSDEELKAYGSRCLDDCCAEDATGKVATIGDEVNIGIEITLNLLQTLANLGDVLMLEGLIDAQVVVAPREVSGSSGLLTSASRTCDGINSHILLQQIEICCWQQCNLNTGGKASRIGYMLSLHDVFLVDLGQTINIIVVALDAEVLCQVDDFYVLWDGVLLEECLALAVSEAEEYHINLIERHLVGKLQIGITNQTFVDI